MKKFLLVPIALVWWVAGYSASADQSESRQPANIGGSLFGVRSSPNMDGLLAQKLRQQATNQTANQSTKCPTLEIVHGGKVYRFADPTCSMP